MISNKEAKSMAQSVIGKDTKMINFSSDLDKRGAAENGSDAVITVRDIQKLILRKQKLALKQKNG